MKADQQKAFESLFKAHFKALSAFAMKYLGDLDESKNLVHDVFILFWEKFESLDDSNHKSYLYTSVRNRCLNAIRDRKKVVDINSASTIEADTHDALEVKELEAEIDFAINSLPEKCRMVFEYSRKEELKYAEIADKMGISVKTVEAQMSKALRLLREHLSDFFVIVFFLGLG